MSDAELTELLGRAAGAAPAPGPRPAWPWIGDPGDPGDSGEGDHGDADASGSTGLTPPRRRWARPVAAAAAVVVALAIGSQVLDDPSTDGDVGESTDALGTGDVAVPSPPTSTRTGTGGSGGVGRGDGDLGVVTETNAASDASLGGLGGPAASAPGSANSSGSSSGLGTAAPTAQGAQPRIVHTGRVELEVDEGAFAGTVERVTSLATGLGGYVVESATAEQDDAPSGSLTVRVPAPSFESLVAEVRRLGDVRSVSTSGQDVTAEYVDLEARLGALRATRDQFLAVLAEAEAIGDILAVQDRINFVNVEIEALEGQRRYLEDQSTFGTLHVTIGEPGAEQRVELAAAPGDGGIGGAWDEARRGFGDAIEWFVARSGKGLVLAAIALAVLAVGQLALRRLRRRAI